MTTVLDAHPRRGLRALAATALLAACTQRRPSSPELIHAPPDATVLDVVDAAPDITEDLPVIALDAPFEAPSRSTLDTPMAEVWPAVNTWNDAMEREYSAFVARLGAAIQARRCRRLDACLRDPAANSLFDSVADRRLALTVDCADLPYILRAYFAFKRRLPFGFVSSVRGRGDDPRYMTHVRPDGYRVWAQFRTPRALLSTMTDHVHSGMYRFAPEVETGDLYPAAVDRDSVTPGVAYYDPNGHVLVVIEVRADGTVFLIDGHPDGSLTYKRFGQAFAIGTRRLGGGFQRFRPMVWDGATLTRALSAELPHFDGESQWNPTVWALPIAPDAGPAPPPNYHAWVRARLAAADSVRDPVRDFREQIQGLCRDITDRVDAVQIAVEAGVHRRPHPPSLPWNIYGTTGDWETWSSPSRDARLKAAFRELRESAAADPALIPTLRAAFTEESARPECRFTYNNSASVGVSMTLNTVLDRLFALSFDPWNCPELRWGAPLGSSELSSCGDDPAKRAWYRAEQRQRNQIDRNYGVATPLDAGPVTAPDVDVRAVLGLR